MSIWNGYKIFSISYGRNRYKIKIPKARCGGYICKLRKILKSYNKQTIFDTLELYYHGASTRTLSSYLCNSNHKLLTSHSTISKIMKVNGIRLIM